MWQPPGTTIRAGTLIDVGAGSMRGIRGMYEAFADAHLVTIDPLPEQLKRLQNRLEPRKAEQIVTALGSSSSELEMFVPQNMDRSSLHGRTSLTEPGTKRTVTVRPLDEIVKEYEWPKPYVLKIDAEGHDLEVLKGAAETLRDTAIVYCETTLAPRFDYGYAFQEINSFLTDQGFDFVDVVALQRAPDGHVSYLDTMWLHRDVTA
jgi:FkbM family methyltransferase